MENSEITFGEFLSSQLRDRGVSLKKLAELTGIAPVHLENLLHGNFEKMPSVPYFRGYVIRIGKVLGFDGAAWWEKIKDEEGVKNSGPADALPRNRFIKKDIPKSAWVIGVIALVVIIYFAVAFTTIFGKPTLTVTYPLTNPYTTSLTTVTLQGIVHNADALYLNGEAVVIAPDGSWQKPVLLSQTGPNTFTISAKKFLGRETDVTEEIISAPLTTSSAASSSTANSTTTTP